VIRASTAALGDRTRARPINVGKLWGEVEQDHPDIHRGPRFAGSYLLPLALYGDLSGRDVDAVTYVLAGLNPAIVLKLRQSVRGCHSFT